MKLRSWYKIQKTKRNPRIKQYRSCQCNQEHIHHSRMEAQYCNNLYLIKKSGEIKEIERQVKYSLDVNGAHIANMYVDFVVTFKGGRKEIHEFKGFGTEVWQLKKKLFEAIYPKIPYVVKTQKDLW